MIDEEVLLEECTYEAEQIVQRKKQRNLTKL